jgi:hypothetical protein
MRSQIDREWATIVSAFEPPVLLVSTFVGRGMYNLGEAVRERFPDPRAVTHVAIEEFLPPRAVTEDLRRYKWLSNHLPFLIYLVHTVPLFYYRKYLRESFRSGSDLLALRERIESLGVRTILCISHRPAFWVSSLRKRAGLDFELWGLLGEYGNTLGWRYIFWDQMKGFLSPMDREELSYPYPDGLVFRKVELPAREDFHRLIGQQGDRGCVLLVCGAWGQGPIVKIVDQLLAMEHSLKIHAVCGANLLARNEATRRFDGLPNVEVHGAVESLVPFLKEAACVVTKPGISTILEAHAAGRKIFLVKGIPVSEDNNARYALRHFGAEWFDPVAFDRWRATSEERDGHNGDDQGRDRESVGPGTGVLG